MERETDEARDKLRREGNIGCLEEGEAGRQGGVDARIEWRTER